MRCLALYIMHAMRSLHGLQPTRGACARTSTLHATSIRGSNGANGPSRTPKQVASHPRSAQFTRAIVRSGKRGEWRRAVALPDQLERTTPRELISERAYGATLIACDRAGCARRPAARRLSAATTNAAAAAAAPLRAARIPIRSPWSSTPPAA